MSKKDAANQAPQDASRQADGSPPGRPGWLDRTLPGGLGLAIFAVILLLPPLLLPSPPVSQPFNPKRLRQMERVRPAYVVMGNSMAITRIDTKYLSQLTGGARVLPLWGNGTLSESWYLLFKNYLVASGAKPKAVFLLFRDQHLTTPYRGLPALNYRRNFERLSHPEEPLFQRIVFGPLPWRLKLRDFLVRAFRVSGYYDQASRNVKLWAQHLAGQDTRPNGRRLRFARLRRWVNQRLALGHLRPTISTMRPKALRRLAAPEPQEYRNLVQRGRQEFLGALQASFLPHIISLAKAHNLEVVFVRVQRRPLPDGSLRADPEVEGYLDKLRPYLRDQGMGYYDFTGDPEVSPEIYGSGDHIAPKYKRRYTEIFHQRLREYFQ